MSIASLVGACFDLRGGSELPDVLPVGFVYLDADYGVYCPRCANQPDVRPLVMAADFVDGDDVCVVCGYTWGGSVLRDLV